MSAESKLTALLEASRTPAYRKVKRVAPEASPQTPIAKAPDPELGHDLIRKERYISPEFMERVSSSSSTGRPLSRNSIAPLARNCSSRCTRR